MVASSHLKRLDLRTYMLDIPQRLDIHSIMPPALTGIDVKYNLGNM